MAKKGQAIQLQTEVNNDEEWEKLLQRDGLIVVDVYADWCGPCSGMTATLKKLKLEIGGDVLQLAIAKSDKITALERFRNKSEPTWMFISNGKMVNFMFGANAPKLTRLIIDELKKENEAREGRRERIANEITDLADEERERRSVVESMQKAAAAKEVEKAFKELRERRLAECHKILETLNHLGIILIFPHARLTYQEAFGDLLGEAGLIISQTEKVEIKSATLDELFFFGEIPFSEEAIEELESDISIILLVKPMAGRDIESIDNSLLEIVYGAMKKPPGSADSPARVLEKFPEKSEEEDQEKEKHPDSVGIWVPILDLNKATALRLFFHRLTEQYEIAEPEPIPPHYAVVFDAIRRQEVTTLMDKYPNEILRYGFFTSDSPEEAKLVAKTIKKYEKAPDRAPEQKMVIQLSRKRSECVLAFVQMKPLYVSPNASEGKRECQLFFGDDYDEPPEEEEEPPPPPPKKKKKKQAEPLPEEGAVKEEATQEGEGGEEATVEQPEEGVQEGDEEQEEGEDVDESPEGEPPDGETQPSVPTDATSEVPTETTEVTLELVVEQSIEKAPDSPPPEPESAENQAEPSPE